MNSETLILAGTAAVMLLFAAAFLSTLVLFLRAKKTAHENDSEIARLQGELENAKKMSAAQEEYRAHRLDDKDEACRQLIASKEEAFAQALSDKMTSYEKLLHEKDKACAAAIAEKEKACAAIVGEKDTALARKDVDCKKIIDEKNAEIAKFLQEKEKSFAAAVETLKEQFANIAVSQMKAQSEGLSKSNLTNLDALLSPLRDQVKLLQDLANKAQKESQSLGVSMSKDVLDIGKIAQSLQHVANALTSNTRFQGRKGEDILAEKLRQAGLEENVNFFLQQGTDSDRPDVQVCDTENRWLIIDSKVSLTAYMEYMEATDETSKAAKLAQHVASVRQKIDQLARKKYPMVLAAENKDRNYLPVTAMFVPYEAPLMEALKAEPSLWQHAAENNVILITPLTLLAYLRLVYLAWQHEKEARNQQEIVDTARELLARMNTFLKTFEDIGRAIETLEENYTKAKGSLVDAPHAHTIAKSARKLIELHVRLENKKGKKLEKAECLRDSDDAIPQIAQEQALDGTGCRNG